MDETESGPTGCSEALFLRGEATPLGVLRSSCVFARVRGLPHASLRVYDAYALVFVLEGAGLYRDANGRTEGLAAGDAVVVFPDLPQTYGAVPGTLWSEFYVAFSGPVFDGLRRASLLDAARPVLRQADGKVRAQILALVRGYAARRGDDAIADLARFYALLVSLLVAGRENPARTWSERAAEWLDDHMAQRDWPVAAARWAGLAPESFRKRFAREHGESPAVYVRRRRLEAAANLLRDTSMPLREIADLLAFSDEYHLSRRFREAYEETPSGYRRKARLQPSQAAELIQ